MDRFTQKSKISYGQNIGNSFKGIFVGFVFLIGSIILLWWNEGRSVAHSTALNEMKENIITLSSAKYDVQYDGQAVLVTGEMKPLQELNDSLFNVRLNGLKLRRDVQMYQWKEYKSTKSEDKLGGSTQIETVYEYKKEWSPSQINSSSFKYTLGHENPEMIYKSKIFISDAQMDDFHLSKDIVSYISDSQAYEELASMPQKLGDATNYKSFLYVGSDPQRPQIGDIKIKYYVVPAGVYTFAAKQQRKELVPYTTLNGKSFVFARNGKVEAKIIFKQEHRVNTMLTWIFRVIGLIMMYVAFSMMMGIVATLAKLIPFLGMLMGGVTGIVAGVLTMTLGSIVIALAWFTSRPLLSLMIIAIGFVIAFGIAKLGKKKEVQAS